MAREMKRTKESYKHRPDLVSILAAFTRDCRMRNMTDESIRRYVSSIRILTDFCQRENYDVITISDEQLLHFLRYLREERQNSQKTVQNVFNALSTYYEFLVYSKLLARNPVPSIRKRYVRSYKTDGLRVERRLLSIDEMSRLISMVFNVRDRAILMVLAKTGIRRNELITLDMDDVDIPEGRMTLKPTAKRSNRIVFFDNECTAVLRNWYEVREKMNLKTNALFVNSVGNRVDRTDIYSTVTRWAKIAGFHDPRSKRLDRHFGPHCFRHWFTTWLIRKGMPRDYVKELRGDARREAIDIYNHIDMSELRTAYLATIPKIF